MQTEFIRRECDFCGTKEEYPKDGQTTPEMEKTLESWITMARVFIVRDHNGNQSQYPVVKHCCRTSCAANILSTHGLELPDHIKQIQQPN